VFADRQGRLYDGSMYERTRSLGYLINQAARLTHRSIRLQLGGDSVQPAYLPVMLWLLEHDGLTQADLCRLARIEQPSMAELLKRMERDGLIGRTRDAADRRQQRIALTAAARGLAERLHGWLEESNDIIRGTILQEDLATFSRVLAQMIDNMESFVRAQGAEVADKK
jgi:MarR family transcriptional regulator for hemolysin